MKMKQKKRNKFRRPELKYALGQIDVQAGRPDINYKRIIKESIAAARRGVHVIIFPEMCLPGYLIGEKHNNEGFVRDTLEYHDLIREALASYDIVVIFGSYAIEEGKVNENGLLRKYNAAIVVHKGEFLKNDAGLLYAIKALHPNYRIFDDARYFFCLRKLAAEMGVKLKTLLKPFTVVIGGHEYKLGIMLCEDMWDLDYYQKPTRILKKNGAEININISCSNWSWQKNRKRHEIVRDIVRKIRLPFIYVNSVGCQNNGKNFAPFDGSSTVYDDKGRVIFICKMYEDTVADIDLDGNHKVIKEPEYSDIAQMFDGIKCATLGMWRAILPRYRKKIVIGLSGGIDSALSAAFFVHLFGADNVILVNMPYKDYNSDETKDIATQIVKNLGVKDYRVIPIDSLVDADAKLNDIKEGTGQHKTLQAAARFKELSSIASLVGGSVICNANKTEIAFGYGTLIGDMRGYFAPWGDCLKAEVYQLADYMNREVYGREVIPKECFDIAPMDELIAQGAGERRDPFDFGHIGHVGYHDAMVRSLLEQNVGAEWFVEKYIDGTLEGTMLLPEGKLSELFPTSEAFVVDLEEKLSWFAAAVHKRVQSVPAAHISKSAFGWDWREYMPVVADNDNSVVQPYYTRSYYRYKKKLLAA